MSEFFVLSSENDGRSVTNGIYDSEAEAEASAKELKENYSKDHGKSMFYITIYKRGMTYIRGGVKVRLWID